MPSGFFKTLDIDKNGIALVRGYDMSDGGKGMRVVKFENGYVVLKHPGGTYWRGIACARGTVPVHFIVFKIRQALDNKPYEQSRSLEVEDAVEINLREQKEA